MHFSDKLTYETLLDVYLLYLNLAVYTLKEDTATGTSTCDDIQLLCIVYNSVYHPWRGPTGCLSFEWGSQGL